MGYIYMIKLECNLEFNLESIVKDFCKTLNVSVADFNGSRKLNGSIQDKYTLEGRISKDSQQVTLIEVNPAGRFGNNLHQILHASFIAEQIGAQHLLLDKISLPSFGGLNGSAFNDFFKLNEAENERIKESNLALKGDFFHVHTFANVLDKINKEWLVHFSSTKLHSLYGLNPENLNTSNSIAVHIRSGDLFTSKPNPWYVQPPLAYYINAVKTIQAMHDVEGVKLIFEDRLNPVVDALEAKLYELGISYESHSSTKMVDDAQILLESNYIIAGKGSFVPALCILSGGKNLVACYKKFGNAGHEYVSKIVENMLVFNDRQGDYMTRGWVNSEEQRRQMIDYPEEEIVLVS